MDTKFTQSWGKAPKFKGYTGDPWKWPNGVYRSVDSDVGTVTVLVGFGDDFIAICDDGSWSSEWQNNRKLHFVRVSDSSSIAFITIEGSANYPDGKPNGGAS